MSSECTVRVIATRASPRTRQARGRPDDRPATPCHAPDHGTGASDRLCRRSCGRGRGAGLDRADAGTRANRRTRLCGGRAALGGRPRAHPRRPRCAQPPGLLRPQARAVRQFLCALSAGTAPRPAHLGAHEYLGELYLQRGELEQARAQLAELERLCPAGCEERSELAEAILAQGSASALSPASLPPSRR